MDNIESRIGLQTPSDTNDSFDAEEDHERQQKLKFLDGMYNAFPELGSLLKKALEDGTPEEARGWLDEVNDKFFKKKEGSYRTFNFDNPVNGRKFTMNVYDTGGKFVKSAAKYSVEVVYQVSDFVK